MIIDSIKFLENKNVFELSIEDTKYLISYEFYTNNNISYEINIDEKLLNKIFFEDEFTKAKIISLRYLKNRIKSSKELEVRLNKEKFSKETKKNIIDYMKNMDIINDEIYAKQLSKEELIFKNNSIAYTKYKLLNKGISKKIIKKVLNCYDSNTEISNANNLIKVKFGEINKENKQKIYKYLASKGFSYEIIKKCINIEYE